MNGYEINKYLEKIDSAMEMIGNTDQKEMMKNHNIDTAFIQSVLVDFYGLLLKAKESAEVDLNKGVSQIKNGMVQTYIEKEEKERLKRRA